MTPEEQKRLAKKWSKVLKNDISKPITTEEANVLAFISESQVKLNDGFMNPIINVDNQK